MEQKKIGAYVRQLLEEQGLSYRQAEEISGVSSTTISRIINGGGAQMENVTKLITALGGTLDGLKLDASTGASADHLEDVRRLYERQIDSLIASHHDAMDKLTSAHEKHIATLEKQSSNRGRTIGIMAGVLIVFFAYVLWEILNLDEGITSVLLRLYLQSMGIEPNF